MPRARDMIVPDAVKGVDELVTRHTVTRMGTVRTTERIVPVLRPPVENKLSQSSRSRKKGRQLQRQPDEGDRSGWATPIIGDTQTHPYIDEQEYDLQDTLEDSQPRATVCV